MTSEITTHPTEYRQWHMFYAGSLSISQQPVGQMTQQPVLPILSIPWGHNLAILSKCKQHNEALYYAQATQTYGWSRSVLLHQNMTFETQGKPHDE